MPRFHVIPVIPQETLETVLRNTDRLSTETLRTDETDGTGQGELLSLTPPPDSRMLSRQRLLTQYPNANLFLGLPLVTTETDSLSADTR